MVGSQGIFHTGGALTAVNPAYILRQADRECQYILSRGEMVFTLAPRQMGKTSLLKRIASQYSAQGWASCIVDLSTLRKLDSAKWFYQMGRQLGKACGLSQVVVALDDQIDLKNFILTELGLENPSGQNRLAVFFDEIEGLIGLEFSDVFLMMLRELYQGRDQYPGRLLMGFAGCVDHHALVKNPHNSPFNVAKEVGLEDLTRSESAMLTAYLEQLSVQLDHQVHDTIYSWAAGQPHLTQRICEILEEWVVTKQVNMISPEAVDRVVENKLLAPHSSDSNLKHILSEISQLLPPASELWMRLISGDSVHFTEAGYYALYLTGAVKHDEQGNVRLRNRIYERAVANRTPQFTFPIENKREPGALHENPPGHITISNTSLIMQAKSLSLTDEASVHKYDVFISYSHKDKDWVRKILLTTLEKNGLKVIIDFRDFMPGAPSITEMERAIKESRKTILVLTVNYVNSAWSEFEAVLAGTLDPAARQRRILPVLLEKCDIPLRINYLTYLDFTDPSTIKLQWKKLFSTFNTM